MSSQTLPESKPANRPVENAPSALAAEEPSFARFVGLVGLLMVSMGVALIFMTAIAGPRILSVGWGYTAVALGIVFMLYLALRDGDIQVRRAFGVLGFSLLGLKMAFTLFKTSNFLSYGWATSLAGMCFLLCFSKHETDPVWRKRILYTLGGVGAAMTAIGLVGGIVADNFLLTYGLLFSFLGLIFLCAFISQSDPMSDTGYRTGLAIGAVAAFVVLYAIFRSAVPALLKLQVAPFFVPNGLLLMFVGVLYGAVSLAIVSDNRLVVLTRRELTGYFYSPVAYIVMLGMALLGALAYFFFINFIARGSIRVEPIVLRFFQDLPPFVVMFVVPAITMRLLAEEKRTGTYEVLMCAPVKETTVVLSKFFACLIFFMLLWGIWALYLIALRVEGGKEFDYRPLLSFYLALAFCGSGFISMGIFFSSLSQNQIIAAVLTFIGMLVIMILGFLQNFEGVAPIWRVVFKNLSYSEVWEASLKGRLMVREMILQGSFTVFWLFLTVKVLEARRWS